VQRQSGKSDNPRAAQPMLPKKSSLMEPIEKISVASTLVPTILSLTSLSFEILIDWSDDAYEGEVLWASNVISDGINLLETKICKGPASAKKPIFRTKGKDMLMFFHVAVASRRGDSTLLT